MSSAPGEARLGAGAQRRKGWLGEREGRTGPEEVAVLQRVRCTDRTMLLRRECRWDDR